MTSRRPRDARQALADLCTALERAVSYVELCYSEEGGEEAAEAKYDLDRAHAALTNARAALAAEDAGSRQIALPAIEFRAPPKFPFTWVVDYDMPPNEIRFVDQNGRELMRITNVGIKNFPAAPETPETKEQPRGADHD